MKDSLGFGVKVTIELRFDIKTFSIGNMHHGFVACQILINFGIFLVVLIILQLNNSGPTARCPSVDRPPVKTFGTSDIQTLCIKFLDV